MKIVYSDRHRLHRGDKEMYRGELLPCFEKPERADYVHAAVKARNIGPVLEPKEFPVAAIERVHAPRSLRFLEKAWDMWSALGHTHDALPAVWPIRGFRDDVEPAVRSRRRLCGERDRPQRGARTARFRRCGLVMATFTRRLEG